MKKTTNQQWPQPLLGMTPIRLRPMGWLDDLMPLRPPSLWRGGTSVGRGLRWSPDMADLSWLFAAYSMLGVELPMPRVQHRSHVSSGHPARKRRTNSRTLLQKKSGRRRNLAIPKWGQEKALRMIPKSGQPNVSRSNLQLIKKIVTEQTLRSTDTQPSLLRKSSAVNTLQKQQRKRVQSAEIQWKLKPKSKIRVPKEVEILKSRRSVLNPFTPTILAKAPVVIQGDVPSVRSRKTERAAPSQKKRVAKTVDATVLRTKSRAKISLAPPPLLRQRAAIASIIPALGKVPQGIRSPKQEATPVLLQKPSEDLTPVKKKRLEQASEPELSSTKKKASTKAAEIRKRKKNVLEAAEKIKKLRFSVPKTIAPAAQKEKQQRSLRAETAKTSFERNDALPTTIAKKTAPISIQKLVQSRVAQIFQREEVSFKKPRREIVDPSSPARKKRESLFQAPSEESKREDIVWGNAGEQKRVQAPNLAKTVLLQKTASGISEKEVLSPPPSKKREEKQEEQKRKRKIAAKEEELQVQRRKLQRVAVEQVRKARTDARITQKLRGRKNKSFQDVPESFQPKRLRESKAPAIENLRRKIVEDTSEELEAVRKIQKEIGDVFERPTASEKRLRIIRELQRGKRGTSRQTLRGLQKEIQIVQREQEKKRRRLPDSPEFEAPKRSRRIEEQEYVVERRKPLPRKVVWPTRSKSKLLEHFELKRVQRKSPRRFKSVDHVSQAVHSFFSAPSKGTPEKRTQSPLLSLQAGTLVFPTPEVSTETESTKTKVTRSTAGAPRKKAQAEAEVVKQKAKKKASYPRAYVAKKSVYRRAFLGSSFWTGTTSLRKEPEVLKKSGKKQSSNRLVQKSLAWKAVWIETEQAVKKATRKEVLKLAGAPTKAQDHSVQDLESSPQKKKAASVSSEQRKGTTSPNTRRTTARHQRYTGLEREAAIFWTRERVMAVPPVVLQSLKKKEEDTTEAKRPRSQIGFVSDVKGEKNTLRKFKGQAGSQKQKRILREQSSPAQIAISKKRERTYSIKDLNWKPKRLAIQGQVKAKRKIAFQDSPKIKKIKVDLPAQEIEERKKRRHFPTIENWRKPPVFPNPFQARSRTTSKTSLFGTTKPELVQAKSISANLVFQPSPNSKIEEFSRVETAGKNKSRSREEEKIESTRHKSKREPSVNALVSRQKREKDSAQIRGVLKRRTQGYLRPNTSISIFQLSGSTSARVGSIQRSRRSPELQIQFYRQAQHQTFLRPEQRPLNLSQIEEPSSSPSKIRRVQTAKTQLPKSMSDRVFRAMEQVVAKKERSLSVQSERQFLRSFGDTSSKIASAERGRASVNNRQSSRPSLSPTRHSALSRTKTKPKNSFPKIEALVKNVEIEGSFSETLPAVGQRKAQEEDIVEVIRKKRASKTSRKSIAPRMLGMGREIGVFLRPRKQVVVEEEEQQSPVENLRPDQLSKDSDIFFIDPSGNLLTGDKATKRMKDLGLVRNDPTKKTEMPVQSQGLPSSFSWNASPDMVEVAMAETRKQIKKQEKPRKIEKKNPPKRVISEMTEEELFMILTALTTSSPTAQQILRDVRSRVEEYFDYERFRKI